MKIILALIAVLLIVLLVSVIVVNAREQITTQIMFPIILSSGKSLPTPAPTMNPWPTITYPPPQSTPTVEWCDIVFWDTQCPRFCEFFPNDYLCTNSTPRLTPTPAPTQGE